jgi:hypothetical protein
MLKSQTSNSFKVKIIPADNTNDEEHHRTVEQAKSKGNENRRKSIK